MIYLKHHRYKLSNSQNEPIFTQNGNLFDTSILNEFCEFAQLVSIVFLPKLELNHMIKEPTAEY